MGQVWEQLVRGGYGHRGGSGGHRQGAAVAVARAASGAEAGEIVRAAAGATSRVLPDGMGLYGSLMASISLSYLWIK